MIPHPPARGSRRALAALAAVALLVAACGGTPSPTPGTPGSPAPGSSEPGATAEPPPSATDGSAPTAEPTEAPTETATDAPTTETAAPTEAPTETPGATRTPGVAAACTGSDDNRAFYAGVAADVAWDVYCPVLPKGWFVETGRFRLAGGGQIEISYKGPGGQRIAIREGYYCGDTTGCVPAGPGQGAASFGDRSANLYDGGDGSWLVVADGGDGLAWEARGTGMDGATLAAYTAAFARVAD